MNIVEHAISLGMDPRKVANWAPIANDLIAKTGECVFPGGTFTIGDSAAPGPGDPFPDPNARGAIVWGWSRRDGVRIVGMGPENTTLRLADHVVLPSNFDPTRSWWDMIKTGGPGPFDSVACSHCSVEGIRFDGNHANNLGITNKAIRIIGEGTVVKNCRFEDFGPASIPNRNGPECFVVELAFPSTRCSGIGQVVDKCWFGRPGRRTDAPAGYTTENTQISIGGNLTSGEFATGVSVTGCTFTGRFDRKVQQAPLHAVTLNMTDGAIVSNNLFDGFEGSCIYTDTGSQKNTVIVGNHAIKVWTFVQWTVQNWSRMGGTAEMTASFDGCSIHNNVVSLSGPTTYAWDAPEGSPSFMGVLQDRDLPVDGFHDVVVHSNSVEPSNLPLMADYGGYWPPAGRWQPSSVTGAVRGIEVRAPRVEFAPPAPDHRSSSGVLWVAAAIAALVAL